MSIRTPGDFGILTDILNAIPRVARYIAIITAYTLFQWGLEYVANQFGYSISRWGELTIALPLAAIYAVRRERTF